MSTKYQGRQRQTRNRKLRKVVLFSAEGLTEVTYLKQLLELRYPESLTAKFATAKPNQTDPLSLLKRIRSEDHRDYSLRAIVCDADVFQADQSKFKDLVRWQQDTPDSLLVLTNPCIEHWFLMHFANSYSSTSTAKQAVNHLTKEIPNYKKGSALRISNEHINNALKLSKAPKTSTEIPPEGHTGFVLLIKELDSLAQQN